MDACLGLIGGVGVGAATHYYRELARAHEARGRTLEMIMIHADLGRARKYVEANDRLGLAAYLTGFITRMQAAGATIAAVPAVTPHMCIRELLATSPLPLLSIFEPVREELNARKVRRAAVFGTRYVIESRLYGFVPEVEFVQPQPDELDLVHRTYIQMAEEGRGTDEQRTSLTALAHTLLERDSVDVVVLAGTDLSLIFDDTNTDFPHVDCAALHLRAINQALLD